MEDVFVYRVPFPPNTHEAITPNSEDDGYTVYIDESVDDATALECYRHALQHIHRCDFEKDCADQIEADAHSK